MYFLVAIFAVIVGICLFDFSIRTTNNSSIVIIVKIFGIALVVVGFFMSYLLLSGKVVLPLLKG